MDRKLDYDEQAWPVELYGRADNVKGGLEAHEAIIRNLATRLPGTLYFPFRDSLPQSGRFYNDVCHINAAGCQMLCEQLDRLIESRLP